MQKPNQGCERSSILSARKALKKLEVKSNAVFVKYFVPADLVIDESKVRSLMEKPCLSGKHDFRKLRSRFVSINGELHSLRRNQEILRILFFRTLALDFNDSSLPDKVILIFSKNNDTKVNN